jgi:hypothetical protein
MKPATCFNPSWERQKLTQPCPDEFALALKTARSTALRHALKGVESSPEIRWKNIWSTIHDDGLGFDAHGGARNGWMLPVDAAYYVHFSGTCTSADSALEWGGRVLASFTHCRASHSESLRHWMQDHERLERIFRLSQELG